MRLFLILLILGVAGCGNTGPLSLPDADSETSSGPL
ncbi:LPS translocon maturation chaperone LptM [Litorivicinus lipolyticus]|nr:lipoprotein [Litorivicinus lipolyticus]